MTIIEIRDVRFAWPGKRPYTLEIAQFAVERGACVLLTGPSGAGKSTLLGLLCGVLKADRGSVMLLGQDLGSMSPAARDAFRAEHTGVIFQMFNLLPYGSVIANVLLPLSFAPQRRARASANGSPEDEARRLLGRLGLGDEVVEAGETASLSVGQQQRVAAARALIGVPDIVIADEPTSALDSGSREQFLELLFAETRRSGATLLMVSHDRELGRLFDRVVELESIAHTRRGG